MFTDHVLVFLVLWAAVGFGGLVSGVLAVSNVARQLGRTATPAARVNERKDPLAA